MRFSQLKRNGFRELRQWNLSPTDSVTYVVNKLVDNCRKSHFAHLIENTGSCTAFSTRTILSNFVSNNHVSLAIKRKSRFSCKTGDFVPAVKQRLAHWTNFELLLPKKAVPFKLLQLLLGQWHVRHAGTPIQTAYPTYPSQQHCKQSLKYSSRAKFQSRGRIRRETRYSCEIFSVRISCQITNARLALSISLSD